VLKEEEKRDSKKFRENLNPERSMSGSGGMCGRRIRKEEEINE